MADHLTPQARSELMAKVRQKNTKPELKVRRLIHRMGYRFRLHRRELPGKPDIVLPACRIAIFVNGCFWHQHPGCKKAEIPGTRVDWWKTKLVGNVRRDKQAIGSLRKLGWRPMTIWECHLKEEEKISRRLYKIVNGS